MFQEATLGWAPEMVHSRSSLFFCSIHPRGRWMITQLRAIRRMPLQQLNGSYVLLLELIAASRSRQATARFKLGRLITVTCALHIAALLPKTKLLTFSAFTVKPGARHGKFYSFALNSGL